MNKTCTSCHVCKAPSEYYKRGNSKDGLTSSCKKCNNLKAKQYRQRKRKDPEWVEKERQRGREKYERLNYKAKQKEWDKNRPWKQSSTYKNLSRYYKVADGQELHHWSYNEQHLKDVFIMSPTDHAQGHQHLIFDGKEFKYRTTEGVLLHTKKQHHEYLIKKGIAFIAYSAAK